jgi:nitric oxide reductase subunit B
MEQVLRTAPFTKSAAPHFKTDKIALAFIVLAMSYLALGLGFGVLGGFQYVLPAFLREHLAFQKIRPLHVYLAIAWLFTAAQGCIYYFLPRISGRELYWLKGGWLHFILQLFTSASIVIAFFMGHFGGREYLEFPPALGILIAISWLPFAINFFATLKPRYKNAPVYYYSWTVGILFFFITLGESYLWLFDHFNNNPVRDITVQWKALGSMVGSWNMLIYGSTIYLMEQVSGDKRSGRSWVVFFFFFLGFTNLLFNWGHHTYTVPAAPYVKNIAFLISMTELLIFAQVLWKFRKSLSNARKNYHDISFRLLSYADLWVILNLALAILISIPAINKYTHGTHITVAHAMGATIGINTMLLFSCIFYILKKERSPLSAFKNKWTGRGISITNISLIIFWFSLVAGGIIKISGKLQMKSFASIMNGAQPVFKLFTASGLLILFGLFMMIWGAWKLINGKKYEQNMAGSSINKTN